MLTVVENYWGLRRAYKVTAERCGELLAGLLDARELRIDPSTVVPPAATTL